MGSSYVTNLGEFELRCTCQFYLLYIYRLSYFTCAFHVLFSAFHFLCWSPLTFWKGLCEFIVTIMPESKCISSLSVVGCIGVRPFNLTSLVVFLLGKIEVKILTRKNAEETGEQWLTEEDTKSFRELLINLLVIWTVVSQIIFQKKHKISLMDIVEEIWDFLCAQYVNHNQ